MFRLLMAAAAATLALSFSAAAHDGVHIKDAYARGSTSSGAVFFLIVNHQTEDDRLISATADVAERAEFHTHTEDANGVMQMSEVPEGFAVPGNGEHALARGGDHIMLIGLKKPLKTGDVISLTLMFERAGTVVVDVPVDNDRTAEGMGHGADAGHASHAGAKVNTSGMPDSEAIVAIMKAQFDTPDNPLSVAPVAVEGAHAIASWAQGDAGGRALLEKRDGAWVIVLCGGPDLRMPAFLADHGVTTAASLSAMFNAAEDGLGADRVALYSSFQGVVMIDGASH